MDKQINPTYGQRFLTHLIPVVTAFIGFLITIIVDGQTKTGNLGFYIALIVPILIIPAIGALFSKARHFIFSALIVLVISVITGFSIGYIGGGMIIVIGIIISILILAQYGVYRLATHKNWELNSYVYWLILIGAIIPLVILATYLIDAFL